MTALATINVEIIPDAVAQSVVKSGRRGWAKYLSPFWTIRTSGGQNLETLLERAGRHNT